MGLTVNGKAQSLTLSGKLVIKGSSNDGSSNVLVLQDSDKANVLTVDTNGILAPGATNTSDLGTTSIRWRDLFLSRNLDVSGTSTLTATNMNGALTMGSGQSVFLQGGSILSLNNANINVIPNGTGKAIIQSELEVLSTDTQLKLSYDGTDNTTLSTDTDGDLTVTPSGGGIINIGMIIGKQGTDIASANDATLTKTGNYFDVTGTTQVNTLSVPTGIVAGTEIVLQFDASVTIKHATSGTGAQFQLAGSVDFSATAGDTLRVVYDGTYWREITRSVI